MRIFGEFCLLTCFVASGYAAFLSVLSAEEANRWRPRLAAFSAVVAYVLLSAVVAVLTWALLSRDFSYEYVAHYSSRLLPWHYRIAALWVGQAGSLLLWAWMMNSLALVFRFSFAGDSAVGRTAFGFVMGNVCFLAAVMMMAADPMEPSLTVPSEGTGLSPLLQHPNMLIHPPIVFLAYALWSVPCALAFAALVRGRLDVAWAQMARPWTMSAWVLLGIGLLLGAQWAYQELGWGGYWGWDPVENGSLLPWLTGTAFLHSTLAWRHRDVLKKTAFSLAIGTFALCNFATFLTRSGIFSSVHAFSESPIGWMFLGLMGVLLVGGVVLIMQHCGQLKAQSLSSSFLARETLIAASIFLLVLLAVVVLVGTLVAPLTKMFLGRMIQVGPAFYNNVLPPIGIGVLAMTAAVPLLQWGSPPTPVRRRLLSYCLLLSGAVVVAAMIAGIRQPLLLAVVGLASLTVLTLLAALIHEARQRREPTGLHGLWGILRGGRRRYAAFTVHVGFVCVALGVTGSSLGTQRTDVTMDEGDTVNWAGYEVHYVRLDQRELPDKLVAEAVLEVQRAESAPFELKPARHLHVLQNDWTTEVDINSTWRGDFYTILHAGLGDGRVLLTLVYNPMIGWIWGGGVVIAAAVIVLLWPTSRRSALAAIPVSPVDTSSPNEQHDPHATAA